MVGLSFATAGNAAFAQSALQGLPHKTMAEPTSISGAHGRFSKTPISLDQPNLALAVALLSAGGSTAFNADTAISNLTGNGPFSIAERAALLKKFGAANLMSFDRTFAFVVTDALDQMMKAGLTLPATPMPDPHDAKALAGALYSAGIEPRRSFDVEVMLDRLVSHIVHVAIMNDIDASELGPAADANYHLILAALVRDTAKAYGLEAALPRSNERRNTG